MKTVIGRGLNLDDEIAYVHNCLISSKETTIRLINHICWLYQEAGVSKGKLIRIRKGYINEIEEMTRQY